MSLLFLCSVLLLLVVAYCILRILGDSSREGLLRCAVLSVTIAVTFPSIATLSASARHNFLLAGTAILLSAAMGFLLWLFKGKYSPAATPRLHLFHLPRHLSSINLTLILLCSISLIVPPLLSISTEPNPTARFAFVLSMAGAAIAASLIAARFGAHRSAQLFAVLFTVTLAGTGRTATLSIEEVQAACWTSVACYFMLRAVKDQTYFDILTSAMASGLALGARPAMAGLLVPAIIGCILFRPGPRRVWIVRRLPLFILASVLIALRRTEAAPQAHSLLAETHGSLHRAGSILHAIVFLAALLAMPQTLKTMEQRHRALAWFATGIVAALLCATIWPAPTYLQCLVLAAAPCGIVADAALPRAWIKISASVLMVVASFF